MTGWFVASWLTAKRESKNKRRDVRITYLLEAYRRIATAANRGSATSDEQRLGIESAIEDIQLLGTNEQLDALHKMISSGNQNFTQILDELRKDLRQELDLSKANQELLFYRMNRNITTVGEQD